MGVREQLFLLGFRTDIIEICKSADVFVFPSKREGLSVALMEAIACGLPCVVSKIRGNVDLMRDSVGGYLVENNTEKEYVKCLADFCTKECKEKRTKFMLQNINRITHYSNEKILYEMKKIYITM